jgi:hypothetical protein
MSEAAIVERVRQWMMRNPRPAFVRVYSESLSTPSDIEITAPPGERIRWANIAQDLVSLEPTMLQALDSDGNVIRVERTLGDGRPAASLPHHEEPRDIPVPQVLSTDPETIRLTHFANLLARAHETSSRISADLQREVITLLLNWTSRVEERLDKTEAEYRAEYEARIQSQIDTVENDDVRTQMERLFFGGAPAQQPQQPQQQRTNGASNGHAAPPRGWGG